MHRATVRTYRHGLGDCHLVSLDAGPGKEPFRILIDCGVILGTPDASTKMAAVMNDVLATAGGKVDLLVATHEHWDHVSGFVQAADAFAKLKVGQVWLAWTEDPGDDLAKQLQADKGTALAALRATAQRLHALGAEQDTLMASLLDFTGMPAGATTASALEAVRAKGPVRYCGPGDAPFEVPGSGAKIYVLGPPRDLEKLKKVDPSKANPETYGLAAAEFASVGDVLTGEARPPFGPMFQLPYEQARQQPFFDQRYFAAETWRRIDGDWTGAADRFALALDNMTNNTSLVLAVELTGGDVLLFAADAQVGNWLSWQDCAWGEGEAKIDANSLLARTVLYKVGHHGSVNATLKANGLERMTKLHTAVIPVDHDMAVKKKRGGLPLAVLEEALKKQVGATGMVIRTDDPGPPRPDGAVTIADGFVEVSL